MWENRGMKWLTGRKSPTKGAKFEFLDFFANTQATGIFWVPRCVLISYTAAPLKFREANLKILY